MTNRWNYLVSETQFATELVVAGICRLSTVPVRNDWPVSHSQTYPLHVGLHSYTSGLERLCKLTIACHGFVADGAFPPLKRFGHKIGDLLNGVESLDLSKISKLNRRPVVRTPDDLDPTLTEALEQFANGPGRYEHLDSLWKEGSAVTTLATWTHLCSQVMVSDRVKDLISVRTAVMNALRTICTENDFEASGFAILDPVDLYLNERSSAVGLHLYKKANWVATTLDALTYYTGCGLPLLGEAVEDLKSPPEEFFKYSVAQIQDEDVTLEELQKHFEQFRESDDDEY